MTPGPIWLPRAPGALPRAPGALPRYAFAKESSGITKSKNASQNHGTSEFLSKIMETMRISLPGLLKSIPCPIWLTRAPGALPRHSGEALPEREILETLWKRKVLQLGLLVRSRALLARSRALLAGPGFMDFHGFS